MPVITDVGNLALGLILIWRNFPLQMLFNHQIISQQRLLSMLMIAKHDGVCGFLVDEYSEVNFLLIVFL